MLTLRSTTPMFLLRLSTLLLLSTCLSTTSSAVTLVDFDDLALAPESYFAGPVPGGQVVPEDDGDKVVGPFHSGGVAFTNRYNQDYDSWTGFAYSNTSDTTTAGFTNLQSAITGTGYDAGADNYAVAFGYLDQQANVIQADSFDPLDAAQLERLPTLELPVGRSIRSAKITNTTYATLSMELGDGFAKAFGGESGNDPDWFKATAYGTDEQGVPLGLSVDFYLADYRGATAAEDYIVRTWNDWDLSLLSGARKLHFNVSSTDVGPFGMNTPASFALDAIELEVTLLPGDYNHDGRVDAADYTVWRDRQATSVGRRGDSADGDLNGLIDTLDYQLWRNHYGTQTETPSTLSVPEPTTCLLATSIVTLSGMMRPRLS